MWNKFYRDHQKLVVYDSIYKASTGYKSKMTRMAYKMMKDSTECTDFHMLNYYCSMVAVIGKLLQHLPLMRWSHKLFTGIILNQMYTKGCFHDCWIYDSLDHQVKCLVSVYCSMVSLSDLGCDYYHLRNAFGVSIRDGVHFLIPYIKNDKIHIQYLHPIGTGATPPPSMWSYNYAARVFRIYASFDKKVLKIHQQFFVH